MMYCQSPGGDTAAALEDRTFYTMVHIYIYCILYDMWSLTTGRQCKVIGRVYTP